MKKYLSLLLCVLLVASMALPFAGCNGDKTPGTTDVPVTTAEPEPVFDPADYNVLSIEDYEDKTMLGFLAQLVGFLSGYEFAKNSDGTAITAMPDGWFEMCNGPYAELNRRNKHTDKLLKNEETGIWETWNDDDFSIDILNQYILTDMYDAYGTFASKVIKDDWIKYNVWDMGGGHRTYGAYGLMSKYFYLPQFSGSSEYGNQYNVNGEPYIANETLGMDAAGMPEVTVNMAEIFGSATSDRDPVLWLKFFAAMYSMAYFEDDVPTLIRTAQKVLPEGCWQSEVIDQVFALKEKYPSDWRRAVVNAEKLCYQEKYDMDSYIGESSINCSFILIGLLYGEGDFYNTCKIISLAGHGGDSTTPVGLGIVGIITGWNGLDETSKSIINEKVWQDGKGVVVNLPLGQSSGYYMYCQGLPERFALTDILAMYKENFESILLEHGGVIKDGNYYIPKSLGTLGGMDTVYVNEFEDGKLDGFKIVGTATATPTAAAYSGKYALQLNGGDTAETSAFVTVSGLDVGKTYRVSGFVSTTARTNAQLVVKTAAGETVAAANIYDQTTYVKRQLVFTATESTMQVGMLLPVGTSAHRYAILDELNVVRIEETSVGEAKIATAAGTDGKYTGKVNIEVNANTAKEVYLKLNFANPVGKTLNTDIRVGNYGYAGAPFYKTGSATDCDDVIYIPVIAKDGATAYTVTIDFGSSAVYLYGAELVTVTERF
ncbi:MAG: carbohydrate binding domain-containing protein [Clostridia bacterium]|nr:carbohydrate binding domain-containing protein [Clostridia bacterium]